MRAFLRPALALSHRLSTRFVLLGVFLLITRFGIWLHAVDALSITDQPLAEWSFPCKIKGL
jgi:hypothetical protein